MAEKEIKNPTYFQHIRHFFDDEDHQCMFPRKWNFTTYETLKASASDVYNATEPPSASMPKGRKKWSQARSDTFFNWMDKGFQLGSPTLRKLKPSSAIRVRKNAQNVKGQDLIDLKRAFSGIMNLPPSDPNSYFALAAIHQLPENPGGGGLYCEHHEMLYNPWHRAYMHRFEDALRTIPGCAHVTVPYWDITTPPPDYLFEPPFDTYTLPLKIGTRFPKGYTTSRNSKSTIVKNINDPLDNIPDTIVQAMKQPIWRDFVSYTKKGIEAAHDSGHVAIGETLQHPDAAAFDPIFWFFHSNWDRLWWEWQQKMRATTLWSFRSTILGNTRFLDSDLLNALEPFGQKSIDVIDLEKMDVGYEITLEVEKLSAESIVFASFRANRGVKVKADPVASVRVKNLNRMKISGSFYVLLKSDRKILARRAFFQPTNPGICPGCRSKGEVSFDFIVPMDQIVGKGLDIEVVRVGSKPHRDRLVPNSEIGEPTINVRFQLEES